MATAMHGSTGLVPPLRAPRLGLSGVPIDELFRWARFLEQGEAFSVSRRRSVEALLEAAEHDADAIAATRSHALRALRQGVATRGVVDLIEAALDAIGVDA